MLKGAEAMSSSTMSCSRGIHQSFGRYPFSLSINELSLASDITAHPWPSTRIFPWYNFVNTSVSLGAEIAYSMDAIVSYSLRVKIVQPFHYLDCLCRERGVKAV
jgi:hypothetical protein